MGTYLHLPRPALGVTIAVPPLGPLPVARGDPVPLLDADPPEPVQVLPALPPQLLDPPRPAVRVVLGRRVKRPVPGVEEAPEPVLRVRLHPGKLARRHRPRERLLVHREHLARPRAPHGGEPAVAVVVPVGPAVLLPLLRRPGRREEPRLLLLLLGLGMGGEE